MHLPTYRSKHQWQTLIIYLYPHPHLRPSSTVRSRNNTSILPAISSQPHSLPHILKKRIKKNLYLHSADARALDREKCNNSIYTGSHHIYFSTYTRIGMAGVSLSLPTTRPLFRGDPSNARLARAVQECACAKQQQQQLFSACARASCVSSQRLFRI